MSRYLIIMLILVSALGVAGKIIYNQGQAIANLKTAVKTEQKARETIQQNIKEQNQKVSEYSEKISVISEERAAIREKGLDHSSRVTKIALEKPQLYENIVNRDFQKTQDKLEELMK